MPHGRPSNCIPRSWHYSYRIVTVCHSRRCVCHSGICVCHSRTCVRHSRTCVCHSGISVCYSRTCVCHSRTCVRHSRTCVCHSRISVCYSRTCVRHSRTCVCHSRISVCYSRTSVCHSRTCVRHSRTCVRTWWILLWTVVQLTLSTVFCALFLTVAIEQDQSKHVHDEPGHTDIYHTVDVLYGMWVCQSLDCLDQDCKTKSNKKHGVDECTEDLSTRPTVRVTKRRFLWHLTTHNVTAENTL